LRFWECHGGLLMKGFVRLDRWIGTWIGCRRGCMDVDPDGVLRRKRTEYSH